LALTHSAISHHIRALENNLGTKLFQRTGLTMTPTSAGTRLAEQVRGALDQLESALRKPAVCQAHPWCNCRSA
jgi:DNA-binding transcriptional LysR family regulator